jgi:glycosyltransferase involved in cell wall biosynthesis
MMHLNHLVIANNTHGRDAVIQSLKITPEKIKLLNNAVELQAYQTTWPNDRECIQLLFVGRFVPAKNPLLFLEICRELHGRGMSFKADIFGEGELHPILEEYIGTHHLSGKVKLKGNVPEAYQLFNQYDFLISTSVHEGTPNVLLEALAAGLPVLSNSNSAAINLLGVTYAEESKGNIFNSAEQACDQLLHHWNDPAVMDAMRKKAASYIEQVYSPKKLADGFKSIIA